MIFPRGLGFTDGIGLRQDTRIDSRLRSSRSQICGYGYGYGFIVMNFGDFMFAVCRRCVYDSDEIYDETEWNGEW